jgi:ATPase family AAA domain-containing protein 1
MTLWDGLTSSNAAGIPSRIVVLGATNRINDIDEAILRRMPKKFPVPLPGKDQRSRILQLVLGDTKRDVDFDLDYVARVTAGMSGSDLKEACRDAAMIPMREYIRASRASGESMSKVNPAQIRGIRTEDFFAKVGAKTRQVSGANRTRMTSKKSTEARRGSSSEYEDVEEIGQPMAEALD